MKMHTPAVRRLLHALVLTAIASGTPGCGRQVCSLAGRVTYLDKPVTSGSVVLYCDGQQIVRGQIGPDGAYAIPNVPFGLVRVTVKAHVRLPDGFKKKYPLPPVINGPITPTPEPLAKGPKALAIPDRYGVPEESGLAVTVDRAVTEFDIRLTR